MKKIKWETKTFAGQSRKKTKGKFIYPLNYNIHYTQSLYVSYFPFPTVNSIEHMPCNRYPWKQTMFLSG